jgi:glycosyltransferase involved in cell wall biosynthesis
MRPPLSILYVAYPLLSVTDECAGGAEQMLLAVERVMARAGHRTTVAAAEGSRVCGTLLATGTQASAPDQFDIRERTHNACILDYLRRNPHEFDLIHDKSGSFFRHAAQCPVPVLATLHLPRSFYRDEYFSGTEDCHHERSEGSVFRDSEGQQVPRFARNDNLPIRSALDEFALDPARDDNSRTCTNAHPPKLYFNCVSNSQARSFAALPNFMGVVQNGIAVERFPFSRDKDEYVLWLGRICEEKAPHLAIEAAQRAGLPLVIAGQVYPFSYHQNYFEREIRPHLNGLSRVRFADTPLASQKLGLLRHARALLLTSTVEETSSLVAMEAMACGTPVVAFRRGAFPEIVSDGKTGFQVDTVEEMAAALSQVARISPASCRERVERCFSASHMGRGYEALYRRVVAAVRQPAVA